MRNWPGLEMQMILDSICGETRGIDFWKAISEWEGGEVKTVETSKSCKALSYYSEGHDKEA